MALSEVTGAHDDQDVAGATDDVTAHVEFVEAETTTTELTDAAGVKVGEIDETIEVIGVVDADGVEHDVAIDIVDVVDSEGTVVDEVLSLIHI